ncbi:Peroxiredoxin [Methanohalobium evestigatum Z-7303]|uniref:Peroxiredoxin n=1 Tax=Methanohalobium evestigatum (strain ATCC BAA-1072 / DSM 3721 / NBRC 107634 / OCM 161 / Z-7303) TaxID=644295 RepID=D7E965_METEZ|nr:redoxin domain-containing protein [Methanohalobium evestigatum]ADI74013.1 Peroxiredoxin [Methanohalobium evestigatum Z-7303]
MKENENTQEESNYHSMPLIGDNAPAFKADSTVGEINFPNDYKGKWVIFFSHPGDFTPVCTTEFLKFAHMQEEFKELNTELLGLSIDSIYSHITWLKSIRDNIKYKGYGNIDITFPIIDDLNMKVAQKYGMIHPKAKWSQEEVMEQLRTTGKSKSKDSFSTHTVRAVFIIDPHAIIRATIYYPLSNGRNLDEIKRLILAMQKSDEENVQTPEGWYPGDDLIINPPKTYESAIERIKEEGSYCPEWYFCLKKDKTERNKHSERYED